MNQKNETLKNFAFIFLILFLLIILLSKGEITGAAVKDIL